MKVAFLRSYTLKKGDSMATDMIGYGATVPDAIVEEMRNKGVEVIDVIPDVEESTPTVSKLRWIYEGYKKLIDIILEDNVDYVFVFHAFHHFPSEIRRMLFDLKSRVKVCGYTHGSHWNPTDVFRFINYPGMEITDLANLYVMDMIFQVSEYAVKVMDEEIRKFNENVASRLFEKYRVVGLPINSKLIDSFKTDKKFERLTIVFNHNLISSKNPIMFVRVMERLLEKYDIQVIFTRSICDDIQIDSVLKDFRRKYPDRVFFIEKPGADPYYPTLWKSHIQVSTATHETFGVATVEAMYTGNCCILPNHCSYPEITGNYQECLYEYNEEELYRKLAYVIEDEEARKRIGLELSRRARKYVPEAVVTKIINFMQKF
jgi:glycosyltransferase involved in cell wall biosynthesis